MQITIHRGTHQIGGCITEIATASSRIFIDMGDIARFGSATDRGTKASVGREPV